MKIVSTGKTLASEDFYRRKLQVRKKKIIFSALGILIALLAILIVLRLESFQIRDIEVVGAEVIGADRVTKEADTFLSGRYLWIIPKNSTFIYPDGSLEKFLLKSFPRFSSIDLSLSSTKRLVVSVVEREPHTLLCQNLQSDCYFLDSTGFVFDKAPFFSRGVYFTHFIEARPEEFLGKKLLGNTILKLGRQSSKLLLGAWNDLNPITHQVDFSLRSSV